jgi:transcriptional regulator with XRE-family HTH domain
MKLMSKNQQYATLQKTLLELRQLHKLTQSDVASMLGKPQSYVSKYESGERRLDVIEFLDVCNALQTDAVLILQKIGVFDGSD